MRCSMYEPFLYVRVLSTGMEQDATAALDSGSPVSHACQYDWAGAGAY